jgi:hypothetical protein
MVAIWKKLAYFDEVAIVSDETAHDVGTSASAGVATDASRHDHIHILGDGSVSATAKLAADVVDGTKIADDAVGSEHIETLSAALDCGKQQLTAAALDNQASDPTTPVLGQVYFKTGDTHPYVCTAPT